MIRPKLSIPSYETLHWSGELPENFTGKRLPGGKVYTVTGDFGWVCVQIYNGKSFCFQYVVINVNHSLHIQNRSSASGLLLSTQIIGDNTTTEIEQVIINSRAMDWCLCKGIPASTINIKKKGAYEFFSCWYTPMLYSGLLSYFPDYQRMVTTTDPCSIMPDMINRMNNEARENIEQILRCEYRQDWRLPYYESKAEDLLFLYFTLKSKNNNVNGAYNQAEAEKMHAIAALITGDITKHYTIPELSKIAGINTNKFKILFKQVYGKGSLEYLAEKRLNKALELLDKGEMVKYAAIEVGWRPADLINAYKKRFGITPTQSKKKR